MSAVTLRQGAARLSVAPALGGTILGYWWETAAGRIDWLRAAGTTPIDGSAVSSFPLVPYGNRIRDGRFTFAGHTVQEPLKAGAAHAIHGHGRSVPWRVTAASEDRLAIAYEHAADAWPWPYRAEQVFSLADQALELRLAVENRSAEAMPAGLGHHPYFPRSPEATVTAAIGAMWLAEAGLLPRQRGAPPPAMDPRRGIAVDRVSLDHAYEGWDRRATLAWPELRRRLVVTADPSLAALVIYAPPGQNFFCVEPASHCVDAFNLAAEGVAGTGMRVLQPGERWESWVRFVPELDG